MVGVHLKCITISLINYIKHYNLGNGIREVEEGGGAKGKKKYKEDKKKEITNNNKKLLEQNTFIR